MLAIASRPPDLLDREREWRELDRAWTSGRPELALVLGRRRAGKSFLLARFARSRRGLYYQATRRTEAEQLGALSRAVGEHFHDAALTAGVPFPDWESLLRHLAGRAKRAPLLVVLDEFPYLVDAAPALPSILQAAWDHDLTHGKLKLVLSGSYVSAMRRLEAADQPLYGRRTRMLDVGPFSCRDAGHFVPKWSPRDRLTAFGLFGGLAGHLALLDPHRSLRANAEEHLLSPSGRLFDEGAHLLDAFLGEAAVHYAILEAVAGGVQTFSRISSRVGKEASSLSRPLAWLLEMGLLQRVTPFRLRGSPSPKTARYRVADPYLAFWHRFVLPLRQSGAAEVQAPARLYERFVAPGLNEHLGPVFEEACRTFVREGGHPRLPFAPVQVGEWWSARSDTQVDVVAAGGASELLVGECKLGPVGLRHAADLEERAALLARELGVTMPPRCALFTTTPPDRALRERLRRRNVLLFDLDDVLGGKPKPARP